MKNFIINFLSAFKIPLTVLPFFRKKVLKTGRSAYRPFYNPMYLDENFSRTWDQIRKLTTSEQDSAYFLKLWAMSVAKVPGNFWECGVYKGGSAYLLSEIALEQKKQVILFDTFSGIPEQTKETDSFEIGSLGDSSLELVQENLKQFEGIEYNKGIIPEVFTDDRIDKISFAHIDVDQLKTTSHCLEFIYPRLEKRGVIVVDDYGKPGTPGARIATDDFCRAVGEIVIPLPTGQGVIIKSD